jgi:signal peptidase I
MTEVRELLRAAIGGAEPALPDVDAVLRRAARRRSRERLVAGALALALTAGVAVGLAAALHRGDGGGPGGGGVDVVGPTRDVYIPSASMEPTLHVGDVVILDEGAYRDHQPRRGDIIVFTKGLGGATGSDAGAAFEFVKRVVGLPGDVVEERDGLLYVNGTLFPMPEPDTSRALGPYTVEPGHLFVVGDNLANSNDSRFPDIGPVPMSNVLGKVVAISAGGPHGLVIPLPGTASSPVPPSPTPGTTTSREPAPGVSDAPGTIGG